MFAGKHERHSLIKKVGLEHCQLRKLGAACRSTKATLERKGVGNLESY